MVMRSSQFHSLTLISGPYTVVRFIVIAHYTNLFEYKPQYCFFHQGLELASIYISISLQISIGFYIEIYVVFILLGSLAALKVTILADFQNL